MGKVFRLHTGANTLEGWDDANAPYGTSAINQIKDPNGATSKKEITSIPSPFARMDLVKVAFKNVTDNHQVEGDTIFHKLVSDCFDVGEIFFNIDKLSDKLRIIAWDRQNDLKVLLDSNDSQHRLLGETLKLYMEQDAQAFNFKNSSNGFATHHSVKALFHCCDIFCAFLPPWLWQQSDGCTP